jgi:hypothetical protein
MRNICQKAVRSWWWIKNDAIRTSTADSFILSFLLYSLLEQFSGTFDTSQTQLIPSIIFILVSCSYEKMKVTYCSGIWRCIWMLNKDSCFSSWKRYSYIFVHYGKMFEFSSVDIRWIHLTKDMSTISMLLFLGLIESESRMRADVATFTLIWKLRESKFYFEGSKKISKQFPIDLKIKHRICYTVTQIQNSTKSNCIIFFCRFHLIETLPEYDDVTT